MKIYLVCKQREKRLRIKILASTVNFTTCSTILKTQIILCLINKEWYLKYCSCLILLSSLLRKSIFKAIVPIPLFSYVYVLKCLYCNYSIGFQIRRAARGRHLYKRYVVLAWFCTTFNLSRFVFEKAATIVNKPYATKTGRYYSCASFLSLVIRIRLQNFKPSCRKFIYSDGHDVSTIRFLDLLLRCRVEVH